MTVKSKSINDEGVLEEVKLYMSSLVAETNQHPFVYKYCRYEGGLAMLSSQNIQFTRADKLNDEDEVNLSKCDFSSQIELLKSLNISDDLITQKISEAEKYFSGIGICSCGKKPDNNTLWERYATSEDSGLEDGICIKINQTEVIKHLQQKGIKCVALLVKYFEDVHKFLPWDLFLGDTLQKSIFFRYLYSSKQKKKWEKEDEIRFMYSEPFETDHFRPSLTSKCFEGVYYGKDMSQSQRIKLGRVLCRYPKIKRFFR